MHIKNYEFKARISSLEPYESKLQILKPEFRGLDHQIDTYFHAASGRLKLREGNIENALIYYERENTADSKRSDVILYRHTPDKALKEILTLQLGIKAVVDKKRRIYFIDNVKFHFDEVAGLGTFLEVEAIDEKGIFSTEELRAQCLQYFDFFELKQEDLQDKSYNDMILAR